MDEEGSNRRSRRYQVASRSNGKDKTNVRINQRRRWRSPRLMPAISFVFPFAVLLIYGTSDDRFPVALIDRAWFRSGMFSLLHFFCIPIASEIEIGCLVPVRKNEFYQQIVN